MPEVSPSLLLPFVPGPAVAEGGATDPPVSPAVRQQETLQPGRYMLRHIGPKAPEAGQAGIINPAGAGVVVLGQTLYAEPLPQLRLPSSPDFSEGSYTLRMLDASEYELTFPNRDASDGRPWRERFSSVGHTEFVEISREGEVESVGVIVKQTKSRDRIVVFGYDGLWLLKKNYEQNYVAVIAPRDLIERYSAVWVPVILTDFALGTSLSGNVPPLPNVATQTAGTGTASAVIGPSGGLLMKVSGTLSSNFGKVQISGSVASVPTNGAWRQLATFNVSKVGGSVRFTLELIGAGGSVEMSAFMNAPTHDRTVSAASSAYGPESILQSTSTASLVGEHTMTMECDGRWVYFYMDGELISILPAPSMAGAPATAWFLMKTDIGAEAEDEALLTRLQFSQVQPFLMRGPTKGDYALPGTAATYPTGGLHGRYIVQGATTTSEKWWQRILAPDPRKSGFPTFIEDQQAELTGSQEPSGVPTTYYAARWFGAVYLKAGFYGFNVAVGNSAGYRLWVGKTRWGDQIIDEWAVGAVRSTGAGYTAERDGWYPIVVEFFRTSEASGGTCALKFQPFVATYSDPGGKTITKEAIVLIPSSSLSPLGCVDARLQGSSFFDLVQGTAKDFGYQLRCEPRQLESGEFPGQLVPKARIGRETDEIIEADDLDRKSGINNYSQTLDSTDSATSVKAFGSGIADGKGSQIAFEALSIADELSSLFDLQSWVAASDIAFPSLLAARAQAELELRAGAWENVEGEPLARDRLADAFPLTGTLVAFHWQPGDGVRLWLPDVGVLDTVPRPILQVMRQFTPEGRTGAQIGFRARPKDPVSALRSALREATRPQRSFQRQYVTRTGSFVQATLAGGALSAVSICTLLPQEQVVQAVVLVSVNSSAKPHKLLISGEDRTTALGGPWSSPVAINILPYAVPAGASSSQRIWAQILNGAEAQAEIDFQLVLTLLV